MAETTNQKTGGATEVRDMIRNAGLDQREIQTLEAYLRNGIQNLQHPSAAQRDDSNVHTWIELANVRGGVSDAGIDLWRNGPAREREQEAGAGPPIPKAISTGQA